MPLVEDTVKSMLSELTGGGHHYECGVCGAVFDVPDPRSDGKECRECGAASVSRTL